MKTHIILTHDEACAALIIYFTQYNESNGGPLFEPSRGFSVEIEQSEPNYSLATNPKVGLNNKIALIKFIRQLFEDLSKAPSEMFKDVGTGTNINLRNDREQMSLLWAKLYVEKYIKDNWSGPKTHEVDF